MKKLSLLVLGVLFSVGVASAATLQVNDSVAGEDLSVRVSGVMADELLSIQLKRPNGSNIDVSAQADEWGIAQTSVFGLHLQNAGLYKISVQRPFETLQESFDVLASGPSAFRSEIEMKTESAPADGVAQVGFVVRAQDAFGNDLVNKKVRVLSSRNSDKIEIQSQTNNKGEIQGYVTSTQPGVSTLSVLVEDMVLFEKPEIVFFLADDSIVNAGQGSSLGQFLKAQLFTSKKQSDVSYFTIEDLPDTVTVDKNLSLRIVARDDNGNVVPDFAGTVRFSSSDDDATLPSDYVFTAEDQGEHTFFLAFRFSNLGDQTLAVHDLSDFRITGEWAGAVVLENGEQNPILSSTVNIAKPTPGTYRANRVTVAGTAVSCPTIKLIDGFTVLTDDLAVDQGGNWIYQTPTLADGVHEFQAFCAPDETIQSNKVPIKIDRTPPAGMSVELVPAAECYAPGTEISLKVGSTEPIADAGCTFEQIPVQMSANGGLFEGTLRAPLKAGPYELSCFVSDVLGNRLDEKNAGEVFVCDSGVDQTPREEAPVEPEIQDIPTPIDFDTIAPTAVSNLQAVGVANGIALTWTPAFDDNGVGEYRLSFAAVSEKVENDTPNVVVSEFRMLPGNSRSWVVGDLTSCVNYDFRLMAIDTDGNEGPVSSAVRGMPICEDGLRSSAPKTQDAGVSENQIWTLLAVLMVAGGAWLIQRRNSVLG